MSGETATDVLGELAGPFPELPAPIVVKNDLMLQGVRFTPELAEAASWAIPNYEPYKFASGEENPTGQRMVSIPYLATVGDDTLIRLRGNGKSPYRIVRSGAEHVLLCDETELMPIAFQPRPEWQKGTASDGTPRSQVGVSQHGDMVILNPAPGCEYFLERHPETGKSMRCSFCRYGLPDKRTEALGQTVGVGPIDPASMARIAETAAAAAGECGHYYLVAGSMTDVAKEGERYLQFARALAEVNEAKIPVTCGSGALPKEPFLVELKEVGVDGVCFNIEVWDAKLWPRVCPGKAAFVGREAWLAALVDGAELFGRGRSMSAFVAGAEFFTDEGFETMDAAIASCLEGTEWLLERGVLSLYSILWPPPIELDVDLAFYREYFLRLNVEQYALRKKHELQFPNDLVCHRCSYLQLETDFDHYLG